MVDLLLKLLIDSECYTFLIHKHDVIKNSLNNYLINANNSFPVDFEFGLIIPIIYSLILLKILRI